MKKVFFRKNYIKIAKEALEKLKIEYDEIVFEQNDKVIIVLCKNIEIALKEKTNVIGHLIELQKLIDNDHSLLLSKEETRKIQEKSLKPQKSAKSAPLSTLKFKPNSINKQCIFLDFIPKIASENNNEEDKEKGDIPDELDQKKIKISAPICTHEFKNRFMSSRCMNTDENQNFSSELAGLNVCIMGRSQVPKLPRFPTEINTPMDYSGKLKRLEIP